MSILYNRALLLAKIETTFRTDAVPVPASDAVLVEDPTYGADATILDRNNVKTHLSPDPGSPGRKIATIGFSHEVRHNGNIDGMTPGKLGVLLRGCGMAEAQITGTETIVDDAPIPVNAPDGAFTYTKTTANTTSVLPRVVELECTTLGGTGVADFTVFSPAIGTIETEYSMSSVVMTNAMTFDLPGGAQITPTVVTDFAVGDRFIINVMPPGYCYEPVSDQFDSLTMYVFYDGLRHVMTGSRGTFTVEGEAGNFARFNFTFTGDFAVATDVTLPTGSVFETTIPAQVELASLTAAGGQDDVDFNLCAQSFSIDMGNNVVARDCINDPEALAGALITGRAPTAAFNPETELEATHPFWGNLDSAARISFAVRVGVEQGNSVMFWAPYAQYASLAYANRNDIRAYDVNMRLNTDTAAGSDGNDELRICFS